MLNTSNTRRNRLISGTMVFAVACFGMLSTGCDEEMLLQLFDTVARELEDGDYGSDGWDEYDQGGESGGGSGFDEQHDSGGSFDDDHDFGGGFDEYDFLF